MHTLRRRFSTAGFRVAGQMVKGIISFAVLLAAGSSLRAQTATITGRVTDPSSAVIAGVHMVALEQSTGTSQSSNTNGDGYYTLPLLKPGRYRLTAEKRGFASAVREDIILDVAQIARVDIEMKLATASQTIDVSSTTLMVQSESTDVGQVIGNKQITEMPLNGRNYLQLGQLTAGALPASVLGFGARTGADGGLIAMGSKGYQSQILLDGVETTSRAGGGLIGNKAQMVQPSIDAVQEFKILTNNYAAEYGFHTGPIAIVSLKSGSNAFHATAYEFLRNDVFDATNFFTNLTGKEKAPYRQNQFGGTVGGPVIRQKTFFFFSYEGTRIRQGNSFFASVPSQAAINGNFSNEAPTRRNIYDPLTTTGSAAAAFRTPFPGNIIPESRMDPLARKIFALYPAANVAGQEYGSNNFFSAPVTENDADEYDFRVDHNLSNADRLYFRFSRRRNDEVNPGSLPASSGGNGGLTYALPADNLSFGWQRVISPTIFNEAIFGFGHFKTVAEVITSSSLTNAAYGIENAPEAVLGAGLYTGIAGFTLTGYSNVGNYTPYPSHNNFDNVQVKDNLSIQKGAHTAYLGFEYHRANFYRLSAEYVRGGFGFTGVYTSQYPNDATSRSSTGNPIADMLLGDANTAISGTPQGEEQIAPYYGAYVQDDWKISPRVTLNLGVRWDFFQPQFNPNGGSQIEALGVSNYMTQYSGVSPDNPLYGTFVRPKNGNDAGQSAAWHNFSPRLGLAWRAMRSTVVRAGFGMFYGDVDIYNNGSVWTNQTPDGEQLTTTGTNVAPATTLQAGLPPITLFGSTPVFGTGVSSKPTYQVSQYVSQWFFDVQQELPGRVLVRLGYQGNKGTHLPVFLNVNTPLAPNPTIPAIQNRPFPQWSSVSTNQAWGNSSYEGFSASVEKQFSHGLTFLTAYTWSHSIDQMEEYLDSTFQTYANPYNLTNERGASALDQRHAFTGQVTYQLPFGKGRTWGSGWNRFTDALLGGWQIGGILTLRTGIPFEVSYPGDPQNTGTLNRGNRIGKGTVADPTIQQWFNQYDFVASAPGVWGNTGRNVLYGPGTSNLDFSTAKTFSMPWEGHTLQFRFESFNFTNTPTFGQPNGSLRTPATGTITSAGSPRLIQFGLKYMF